MATSPSISNPRRPKLLVLEFWGLGDLTFVTPFLRAAGARFEITLVAKQYAADLLRPTFPDIHFVTFDAPWSVHRNKYALWRWSWRLLLILLARLRHQRFDAAVSVRSDPRDHFLMWLVDARTRLGFPRRGSRFFLTQTLARRSDQHRVENWRDLGRALALPGMDTADPVLAHVQYRSRTVDELLAGLTRPIVCLHPGARIPVRRWPEAYFAYVVEKLRRQFDFHFVLIPDLDGYGESLRPLADVVLRPLSIAELVDVLGRVDLLLCNDSGPGHIAAACGRPVISIFGPGNIDWFYPWNTVSTYVARDICPWRPCFDYCKFDQPYCLTRLEPEHAWQRIHEHLRQLADRGALPAAWNTALLAPS